MPGNNKPALLSTSQLRMRTQYVCFTKNNWTPFDLLYLRSLVPSEQATYSCWGMETAPSTGTRHLQGYIELPNRLRIAGLRKLLPGCHIEARRGSAEQARNYCSKVWISIIPQNLNPNPKFRTKMQISKKLVSSLKRPKDNEMIWMHSKKTSKTENECVISRMIISEASLSINEA